MRKPAFCNANKKVQISWAVAPHEKICFFLMQKQKGRSAGQLRLMRKTCFFLMQKKKVQISWVVARHEKTCFLLCEKKGADQLGSCGS